MRTLRSLASLGCLALGLTASAADVVWCGADGGSFTNAANWTGGVKPGKGDVCVFRPSGALSVVVPNGASYASGMRFESGATTFSLEGSYAYTGFATATGTVEVAEGATFEMKDIRIEQRNLTLRKTGKGTWSQKGYVCRDSSCSSACVILVEEGALNFDTYLTVARLAVPEGASCSIAGYNRVLGDCVLELDGSLDIDNCRNKMTVAGLSGSGTLSANASEISYLVLAPAADCLFTGVLTGNLKFFLPASETGSFIVGATETLAAATSVEAGSALRFAAGVGSFAVPGFLAVPEGESIVLEDVAGEPVTLFTRSGMTLTGAVTGAGQFAVTNDTKDATLTLGDGTTDADLSGLGSLGAWSKGKIAYRNAQPLVQTAALVGDGDVSVGASGVTSAGVTLADFRKSGGTTTLYAPLTIAGGDGATGYSGLNLKAATTLTIDGGLVGYTRKSSESYNYRTIPVHNGLIFGSVAGSKVVQNGGRLSHNGDYNAAARRYELKGGELAMTSALQPASAATTESPCVYLLDGGAFGPSLDNAVSELFKSGNDQNGKACAGRLRVLAGARGATLASFNDANLANPVATFNLSLEPETEGADGGVTVSGGAAYSFSAPIRLAGDVTARGVGLFLPDAADTATTPRFFGDGGLRLRNAPLVFQACTADKNLALAPADGKGVSYEGACAIRFRRAAGGSNLDYVANADGCSRQTLVSGPLTRAGKGSVLFLWDGKDGLVGNGDSSSTYTVSGGVASGASGAVAQPILGATTGAFTFLAYDETAGFRPFTDYADWSAETTDASIAKLAGSATVAANATKAIGGACLSNGSSNTDCILELSAGATLKVGNGTDPAVLAFGTGGYGYGVLGPGTLDFGTSEGVICVPREVTDGYCVHLACPIAGSGGVTFASVPDSDLSWRRVRVSGANSHSGGTWVNAVRLEVAHAKAFGTGVVHVGGGARFGGRVAFDTPLTVANGFRIAGAGIRNTRWDGFHNQGALEFNADVTLTGDVEIAEPARIVIPTAGKTATLSGTVSGAALEVLKTGTSKLLLTGHNTYTGGTEVVSSVLALTQGDGAGTGRVLLDAGTLRFENAEAVTFSNRIEGNGKVVLAGSAPVTFAGEALASLEGRLPFATFAAGTTIDLADAAQDAYMPFFDGAADLGGRSLSVAGIAGSGTVANGTLTVTGEISPAGEGAVGTLTFGEGTLVLGDGATFVCDVKGGQADRIVVAGGLDLSKLSLRVVRNDAVRAASPQATILEATTGSLTGAFASVSLPRRSWSVECGEKAAWLNLLPGAVLIVR